MDNALIVVDIQNDFCPGGVLAVPKGDTIIPVVNRLMHSMPIVVLTQDWHPPMHCSFASTWGREPFSVDTRSGVPTMLWPDHCVAGTKGAEFHPSLESWKAHCIIRKGNRKELDSYSAFFENDGKTPTGLAGYLREIGVKKVAICGLATDYCVKASAVDACRAGFETMVIEDAILGIDANPGDIVRAIEEMKQAGCHLVHSSSLC